MRNYYLKIFVVFIISLASSNILTDHVIYKDTPQIRTEFKTAVSSIPVKIVSVPTTIAKTISNKIKTIALLPSFPRFSQPNNPNPSVEEPQPIPTEIGIPPGEIEPPNDLPVPTTPVGIIPRPTSVVRPTSSIQPTSVPRPTSPPAPTATPRLTIEEERQQFLTILNSKRSPVILNGILTVSAQKYAELLTQKLRAGEGTIYTLCTHDYGGTSPQSRAMAVGFPNIQVSENLVCGMHVSPQQAFDMWMEDDVHRNNMLSGSWHQVGIGVADFWALDLSP